jgi:hypothetical protein
LEEIVPTVKELFSAYNKNELPREGGYIVSSFFLETSAYTKYEITSYNNVKSIHASEDGLTFQADGKKLYILVEPVNYDKKHTEPSYRDDVHKIPYRFKELEIFTTKRQDKVMVGKEPIISYGSFTILKTMGNNYSYIFFPDPQLERVMVKFFRDTMWKDANVPRSDAVKISKEIGEIFRDFMAKKIV